VHRSHPTLSKVFFQYSGRSFAKLIWRIAQDFRHARLESDKGDPHLPRDPNEYHDIPEGAGELIAPLRLGILKGVPDSSKRV
jgi:hypothetical protein